MVREKLPPPPQRHYDLLVVGAGLAGTAAALQAAGQGASVALAWAGPGSSERAQGGVAAAVGPDDGPEQHAMDTLEAGASLCDARVVGVLTQEAAGAIDWLTAQGVAFDRDAQGELALALEAAHGRPRIAHADGDRSGAAIMRPLRFRLQAVTRFEGARLLGLLRADEGVVGARFQQAGREMAIHARSTILATGGYAGLYLRTTNSPHSDGAGLMAALEAGAELADLEFVQFHPTVFAGPGQPFLVTEALRGEGAWLASREGRRFLFDFDTRGELAPRALVSRAIASHLRARGEAHVLLDARPLGVGTLRERFAGFLGNCRRHGIDPLLEPVPVAPAAHYTMGGILTDELGRTRVPGLYAAGECARTGVHGANRLASNSLLEAVVFGRRAAQAALGAPLSEFSLVAGSNGSRAPVVAQRAAVGVLMDRHAGQLRCPESLGLGLQALDSTYGSGLNKGAGAELARLVLESALIRVESRGAHARLDFAEESQPWAALQIVAAAEGTGPAVLSTRPRQ